MIRSLFRCLLMAGSSERQTLFAVNRTTEGGEDHFRIRRSQNESTECIHALLQGPQERGFRPARKLPLPDRSKGLRKEVREVFGDEVLIQRCRQQKRENIIPGSGIWTLPQMSGKIWSRRGISKKENCRH